MSEAEIAFEEYRLATAIGWPTSNTGLINDLSPMVPTLQLFGCIRFVHLVQVGISNGAFVGEGKVCKLGVGSSTAQRPRRWHGRGLPPGSWKLSAHSWLPKFPKRCPRQSLFVERSNEVLAKCCWT